MSRDDSGDNQDVVMEAGNDQPMDVEQLDDGGHVDRQAGPRPNGDLARPPGAFPMFWAEPIRLAQPSYPENDVMDYFEALEVRRMWREPPAERAHGNNAWMDVYRPPVPLDPDRDAGQIFADAANGGVVPLEHLMNMGEIELGEFNEFESDGESSGIGTDNEQDTDDDEPMQPNFINFQHAH